MPVRPVDHTRFRDVDPEERKAAALPSGLRTSKSNGLSGTTGQTLDVEVFKKEKEMNKSEMTPKQKKELCRCARSTERYKEI